MANSPWCIKKARGKYKGWLCLQKAKLLSHILESTFSPMIVQTLGI